MADFSRLTSVSILPNFAKMRERHKRKRADDDAGLLPNSVTESQLIKRQKYVTYCNKSNTGGSRDYFYRGIDSLVRQSIYANDKKFDQLSFQGHQSAIHTNNVTQASNLSASPTLTKAPAQCSLSIS